VALDDWQASQAHVANHAEDILDLIDSGDLTQADRREYREMVADMKAKQDAFLRALAARPEGSPSWAKPETFEKKLPATNAYEVVNGHQDTDDPRELARGSRIDCAADPCRWLGGAACGYPSGVWRLGPNSELWSFTRPPPTKRGISFAYNALGRAARIPGTLPHTENAPVPPGRSRTARTAHHSRKP
jgi:hypothetical protein